MDSEKYKYYMYYNTLGEVTRFLAMHADKAQINNADIFLSIIARYLEAMSNIWEL